MKATIENKSKRPARVMLRTSGTALEVTVRDARGRDRKVRPQGVYLDPGEKYSGHLPAVTKRGKSVLGVHTDEDRPADLPTMRDGGLSIEQALIVADEFDTLDRTTYTAREFVQWWATEVLGTDAHAALVDTKAALTAANINTLEDIAA